MFYVNTNWKREQMSNMFLQEFFSFYYRVKHAHTHLLSLSLTRAQILINIVVYGNLLVNYYLSNDFFNTTIKCFFIVYVDIYHLHLRVSRYQDCNDSIAYE